MSLFFVRHRGAESGEPSTFRAWGYPWAPAVFCLVSFAIVGSTTAQAPAVAMAGLGVMVAGVPAYWWLKVRRLVPSPRDR